MIYLSLRPIILCCLININLNLVKMKGHINHPKFKECKNWLDSNLICTGLIKDSVKLDDIMSIYKMTVHVCKQTMSRIILEKYGNDIVLVRIRDKGQAMCSYKGLRMKTDTDSSVSLLQCESAVVAIPAKTCHESDILECVICSLRLQSIIDNWNYNEFDIINHSLLCKGDKECMNETCRTYHSALVHLSKITPVCRVVAPYNKFMNMYIEAYNKSRWAAKI